MATPTPANAWPAAAPERRSSPNLDLARAAATGDNAATARLLRAVAPEMARVVRAVLGGGNPDLDDVLQQSLIALVRALPAFRGECDPAGYAATIAVRTALATRKRGRIERMRHDDGVENDATPCHDPSPGDEAAARSRKRLLRELLAELPDEQAEALALRSMLGWSLEEIADNASAPLNTIRSRLRLAKESLRRRIEADPQLFEELEVGR